MRTSGERRLRPGLSAGTTEERLRLGLFAGTTEGRLLAERLSGSNADTDVFVATEYGKEKITAGARIHVFDGRLGQEEMLAVFRREKYAAVIDATHPYAALVSENLRAACEAAGIPLLRVLRERGRPGGTEPASFIAPQIVSVPDVAGAVAFLSGTEGNILVTTGSKELAAFCRIPDWESRVYARVLSLPEVVKGCAELGFYGNHLIAMQGPFSAELNEALLKSVKARWMVTKESGRTGGFEEKAEAAGRAGVRLVVIGRPEEKGLTPEETWSCLKESFGLREMEQIAGTGGDGRKKRKVWLLGAGPGAPSLLTVRARQALSEAQAVIGSPRLLEALADPGKPCLEEYRPAEIVGFLKEHPEYETAAAVFSGDTGFYSGARGLLAALQAEPEFEPEVVPGISSLAAFFAAVGKGWEEARAVSLHGRHSDWLRVVRENRQVFLLAGDRDTLKEICRGLLAEGLNDAEITVGERLSLEREQIFSGAPKELAGMEVDPLSVLLIENPHAGERSRLLTCGLPDSAFMRGEVPMTKREVRAVSLSMLELTEKAVVYDVGAGTGSVSVECARLSPTVRVYAIERKPEAVYLLKRNREQFGLTNLEIIEGTAPEAFSALPPPTHVFVGGSSGKLAEILEGSLQKNPRARFVVNAVTVESIAALSVYLKTAPVEEVEYTVISASRSRQAGASHLMTAQNPVWIVSFCGKRED